ncbi:MAG: D-glycero-beta-D-manno-heptose-7-phosphate kinase [Pyrinomonadaceae bacterium]
MTRSQDSTTKTGILVIGDVMLDRYWWGEVTRISPEAPVPVVRLKESTNVAGGAANVAGNIAGLGGIPILIGCIGNDIEGKLLPGLLAENGISSEHLLVSADRPTTVKTRIVAHNQHVARVDHESTDHLSTADENRVIKSVRAALGSVKAVVISDYAKGFLTENVLREVIDAAREANIATIVDPKGKRYEKYRGATLLTPNKIEAAEACNLDPNEQDIVRTAGMQLLSENEGSSILITEGENGMTLFCPGEDAFHTQASARDVFDVTGAGDTVVAALSVAIAEGVSLRDAVDLANCAAGIAVEKVGTTIVTKKMISDRTQQLIENAAHL